MTEYCDGSFGTPVEPVAVVGASCRLPGGVDSLGALWRLLEEGRETVGPVPEDRWDAQALERVLPEQVAELTRVGGWLAGDIGGFDPQAFGMSGREADWLDPQHRLLLMVAWEALEHAGIPLQALRGSRTGVFAGMYSMDNLLRGHRRPQEADAYWFSGAVHGVGAGRLSYLLDLHGPSLAVDTACSSSLVAVHLACQALRAGECPLAVAGGVSAALGPEVSAASARWRMYSPTGRCRAFDEAADGYLRAEGCGVVVLKLLAAARRDGDRVLALLRGSAVNQDGHSDQLTVPSSRAQAAVFTEALGRAGVEAGRVGMVEAHGTGTPVGDPREFAALKEVYGTGSGRCAIGSVKTNIGHTEPASGVVGLLKAVVCLQRGRVPASLHFTRWHPEIDAGGCRLFVPTRATEWPVPGRPRLAAVSSYGVGGTNAHVIVEEAPAVPPQRSPEPKHKSRATAGTFLISAASPGALRKSAAKLADWLEGDGAGEPLPDAAYTLAVRRSHQAHRAAVLAGDRSELAESLRRLAAGRPAATVTTGRTGPAQDGAVFVYSGHGSQWARMGQGLIGRDAAFTTAFDELEPLVQAESGFSLREVLASGTVVSGVERVQPTLFALQVALTAMWRARGVVPAAVIGHSMGEVAAAVACGALALPDGVKVICRRSRLLTRVRGGAMAVVRLPADEVSRVLADGSCDRVEVAVVASPSSTAISGDAGQIERLLHQWEEEGVVEAARVAVEVASHSAQMDPILAPLRDRLADVRPRPPSIPFYSTVTEDPREPVRLDAGYWADNQRRPVRFASAVRAAQAAGHRLFVEVNAHPLLAGAMSETLAAHGAGESVVVPTLRREGDEEQDFAAHVAAVHCAGYPVPWNTHLRGRLVDAPGTCWEEQHHWIEPSELSRGLTAAHGGFPDTHPLLGVHVLDPAEPGRHLWQATVDPQQERWLKDHHAAGEPAMAGAAWCEMALTAAAHTFTQPVQQVCVREVTFDAFLPLGEEPLHLASSAQGGGGTATWRVTARAGDAFEPYAGATLAHATDDTPPARVPVERLRRACSVQLDIAPVRERWAATCSVVYGPAFRTVQSLHLSPDTGRPEALARLHIPDAARPYTDRFAWHPVLLDGCLQTLLALWTSRVDLPQGTAYPQSIGELQVHGDTVTGVYCHVRIDELGDHTVTGSLRLLTTAGDVVGRAENIRFAHTPEHPGTGRLQRYLIQHRWQPRPLTAPRNRQPATWLLITENEDLHPWHRELETVLNRPPVTCNRLTLPLDDEAGQARRSLDQALRHSTEPPTHAVVLLEPDNGDGIAAVQRARRRTARLITVVQALADCRPPARLHILSHHGQATGPQDTVALGHAGLRGALRTLLYEHPELHLALCDTDTRTPAQAVAAQLLADDTEDEVAWRNGLRYVARLAPAPLSPAERRTTACRLDQHPVRAEPDGTTVTFTAAEPLPEPARHQVRIAVHTTCRPQAGPGTPPPATCAGTVTATGSRTTLAVGQQVVVLLAEADLVSHLTVEDRWCVPVPAHLDAAPLAGSLLPYLTAHYGLHHVARVRPGDRVLILGSQPLATALRHTATAAGAQVHTSTAATDRSGLWDIIIDTTPDPDPRPHRLLAPAGQLLTSVPHPAGAGAQGTAARAMNIAAMLKATPGAVACLLRNVTEALDRETLPLLPVTQLPLEHTTRQAPSGELAAYRWPTGTVTASLPPDRVPLVRPDGAYVITGGLGGLGMVLARWLTGKGAGTIVLNSRTPPGRHTQTLLSELRHTGTRIEVICADLAEPGTAEHLLRTAEHHGHTPRGVIHAAAVVDDATATALTEDLLERVWRPKAQGAWLLHQASTSFDLDWWVGFSSFVPLLGSPGQTAYASASAWLDALITHRAAADLPATGINWGAWAETGIGARTLGDRGFATIPLDDALAGLELLLTHARTHTGFVTLDLAGWLEPYPAVAASPYLSPLLPAAASTSQADDPTGRDARLQALLQAPSGRRHQLLQDFLADQAAALLGCSPHRVEAQIPLPALGMDSLITVRLRNRLQQSLSIPLPRTVLHSGATITALADYLDKHLPQPARTSVEPTPAPRPHGTPHTTAETPPPRGHTTHGQRPTP
ncbi:acyltransferase domain-containing protein [Streptomyces sp. NPDC008001]|uniref:acyltransferase domain-containing protein n=1 Tax=Streptomyces sp. NPDC008001 TaxID=3364804 RepID=UPI0036F006DF